MEYLLTDTFKQGEVFKLKGVYFTIDFIATEANKMTLKQVGKLEAQNLHHKHQAVNGLNRKQRRLGLKRGR